MDDRRILELFTARDEEALERVQQQYGAYCRTVALRSLRNEEDARECVNDALLHAWHSIPPASPENLRTYLGGITRHLAIERLEKATAGKRPQLAPSPIDEFAECMPDAGKNEEAILNEILFRDALNAFLEKLPKETRVLFLRRYFFNYSLEELARLTGKSVGTIKSTLHRTRKNLKDHFTKEGIFHE